VLLGAKVKPRQTHAEYILAIDIEDCLRSTARDSTGLSDLRDSDKAVLLAAIEKLGLTLAAKRKQAIDEYSGAATKVTDATFDSLPKESYRVQRIELLEKLRGGTVPSEERRLLALDITREKIGRDYEKAVQDGIESLRKLQWAPEGTAKNAP